MRNREIKSILKTIAVFSTLIFIFIIGFVFIKINTIIAGLPNLDTNQINVHESTKVFDQNNRLIVELGVEKRDIVSYDQISKDMVNALIAIEDTRFFEHHGIDYKRIMGAFLENIKTNSYKEGASTLTQQLVKLSYLSNEKTLNRKLTEIFLSIELENRISKDEIIEAYLNRVLFGGRIYGVERASEHYFSKHAKDLNYEESALLAGMVQSPNRYNPFTYPELAKERQTIVLNQMYKYGFITNDELIQAVNRPLSELVKKPIINDEYEKYYEYIDQVINELATKYQLDPLKESLKVYTYLDKDIQDEIYRIENDPTNHPNDKTQTGIVVLETNTGIIRGIGGGRNHEGSMSFNFATNAKRQPGSTIKPILDYGPAIEYLNYSTGQPFLDDKTYYSTLGSRFVPIENYDNKYKGYVTMREALIDSRNVTAVKVFRQVGAEKAYAFANKLGITTDEPITEAHAIGGYQYGFSVLQMAGAYAPFGSGGIYHEPTTIQYIIKDDQKIESTQLIQQAMREDTAYLMTDILHDNMISGTATRANVSDLIIAGKTGQTNYNYDTRKRFDFPSNSVRDSWFIGYTTKYTTAVWLGYDKIEEGSYLTPTEAKKSLEIFKNVMQNIHKSKSDSKPFKKPSNIVEVEIETHHEPVQLPSEYTPSMYRSDELFIQGTEPKEVSNRFKPLDPIRDFMVYYDYMNEKLVLNWSKYPNDFTNDDYALMDSIHQIENQYDTFKNNTLKEFYQNKKISFFSDEHLQTIMKKYCNSDTFNSNYCPFQSNGKLNTYLDYLETLKNYEINSLIKDDQKPILSQGEMSELRGYPVWNGYHGGLYSNLGNINYIIVGKKGDAATEIYRGPYTSELKLTMTLDQFLSYDSFYIYADYSRYQNRLQSNPTISLNPFFNLY